MIEFVLSPTREKILINPKYIVSVRYDGYITTKISTADNNIITVDGTYESIKQTILNHLPPE